LIISEGFSITRITETFPIQNTIKAGKLAEGKHFISEQKLRDIASVPGWTELARWSTSY